MKLPPKTFTTVCHIVGLSEEKTAQNWRDVSEKIIDNFLTWLINDGSLSVEQQNSLEILLTNIDSGNKTDKPNIVDSVSPILDNNQKDQAINKFAEIFTNNLESFYSDLKGSMTVEQRQVADSYLKTSYVRADN